MFVLNQTHSIANTFLAELRDKNVQLDRMRFRHNLKRLGTLLAYELSKDLDFETRKVDTPLTQTSQQVVADDLVIVSILRAAIPFYEGFIDVFDGAEVGFIGAAREESKGNEVAISLNYTAAPDLNGKTLILVDPMLATGKSLVGAIDQLLGNGTPNSIHLASVIAAPEGIKFLNENLNLAFKIWSCALDEKLNDRSFIVPGLGDAGDLAFGPKL